MTRLLASPRNGLAQRTVDVILGHEWLLRVNGLGCYVEAKVAWRAVVLAGSLGWMVRRVVEDRRERERREAFWKGERIT